MGTGDRNIVGVGAGPRVARGVAAEFWKHFDFRTPDFGHLADGYIPI